MNKLNKSKTGLPSQFPTDSKPTSYLADETFLMEKERREQEQKWEKQFAKVHAREHDELPQSALEEGLQNDRLQHPYLGQRYDGVERIPRQNTEERMKFDNDKREQDKEKQNRLEHSLGIAPKMGTAPKLKPS